MSGWSTARGLRLGRGTVAVLLIALAVLLGVLYRVSAANGQHSYDRGSSPPASVHLTRGSIYRLSTRDGVPGLQAAGLDPANSTCQASYADGGARLIGLAAETSDTRATHVVGTFSAPQTGRAAITCQGWPAVFVDDADHSPFDLAGFFLAALVVVLAGAVAVGLSWLSAMRRSEPGEMSSPLPG